MLKVWLICGFVAAVLIAVEAGNPLLFKNYMFVVHCYTPELSSCAIVTCNTPIDCNTPHNQTVQMEQNSFHDFNHFEISQEK